MFEKDDLSKMNVLRRIISPMGTMDGIEFLIAKLKNTKNNSIFDSMNKSSTKLIVESDYIHLFRISKNLKYFLAHQFCL